jgi:hypothetical protein
MDLCQLLTISKDGFRQEARPYRQEAYVLKTLSPRRNENLPPSLSSCLYSRLVYEPTKRIELNYVIGLHSGRRRGWFGGGGEDMSTGDTCVDDGH